MLEQAAVVEQDQEGKTPIPLVVAAAAVVVEVVQESPQEMEESHVNMDLNPLLEDLQERLEED